MRKILVLVVLSVTLVISSVAYSNVKNKTYTMIKYEEIKVGEDIPPGKYKAEINNSYIFEPDICTIEKKDDNLINYGESLIKRLIEYNPNKNTFVYEVEIPKDKSIISNLDVVLTKK